MLIKGYGTPKNTIIIYNFNIIQLGFWAIKEYTKKCKIFTILDGFFGHAPRLPQCFISNEQIIRNRY